MITAKQGLRLSAIVDKLDISITNPGATKEQVGADMIMKIVRNAHKAEKEIYEFIALVKKCTVEEAEEIDLVKFLRGMFADPEITSFFNPAAISEAQE